MEQEVRTSRTLCHRVGVEPCEVEPTVATQGRGVMDPIPEIRFAQSHQSLGVSSSVSVIPVLSKEGEA